jgi:hypothetical protein
MAMASFTRLPPSVVPTRKKSVRKCCFHCARADAKLARDVFVTASLDKQIQDLLVARCDLNFNFIQIDHGSVPSCLYLRDSESRHALEARARASPIVRAAGMAGLPPLDAGTSAMHQGFHVAFRNPVVGYEFQIGLSPCL